MDIAEFALLPDEPASPAGPETADPVPVVVALCVELEAEEDGQWTGAVPELAGVIVFADSRDEAARSATARTLRELANRVERGEVQAAPLTVSLDVVG